MSEQQLPEGWKMVKFGDIAKHISKRVEPSETDLDIYVGLEHLDPDSLEIKRHGVPSDVAGQKLLVKKGQIIFGKRRAYQRKVAVADWDCICSAHAMVLEANTNNVIPDFLPFFMQSGVFMNRAVAISEGSLSPTIKWKTLETQMFPFPDIKHQEKILKALQAFEVVLTKCQQLISSSNTLRSSTRAETLYKGGKGRKLVSTHWGSIPEGWSIKPFSYLSQINPTYKFTNQQSVTFCDMAALATDSMKIEGSLIVKGSGGSGARFKNGDVLFARITPCAENGKMAIVDFLEDNAVGQGSTEFIVLSPKNISSEYLYHLCRTNRVRQFAINNMEGTTGRQRIPAQVFENIMLPVPPKGEIGDLEEMLSNVEALHSVALTKLATINLAKKSYMQKIFGVM
ncbi:restriction endonuclease subunit S [Plesiomonas shigelloides]|uniref:restriction endonuclease subunit S n=1 Tax=Plesiomonas shigelloides TaxID=703 RepID=UPI0022484500|nr:restriction endonuclease subunit S [Plesiomonas shigelloides]MCX2532690.1 restriction endonuclease subunit S [Plesiomonas shigelloides]